MRRRIIPYNRGLKARAGQLRRRFWDYQVKKDKRSVLEAIEQWIQRHEETHP